MEDTSTKPQTIIQPTVGRVVWYWPGEDDFAQDNADRMFKSEDMSQPMRADICFVHLDGSVTLSVNDHLGDNFQRPNVYLYQGDEPSGNVRPFASWMPFQKGQAAKTEAAEKGRDTSMQQAQAIDLEVQREKLRSLRLQNDHAELVNEAHRGEIEATKLAIGALRRRAEELAAQGEDKTPG